MTEEREEAFFNYKSRIFFWGGGGGGRRGGGRLTQALAFFDQKHGVTPLEK